MFFLNLSQFFSDSVTDERYFVEGQVIDELTCTLISHVRLGGNALQMNNDK